VAAHRSGDKDDARPPRKLILRPAGLDLAIPRYPNPGRWCPSHKSLLIGFIDRLSRTGATKTAWPPRAPCTKILAYAEEVNGPFTL
jgi:hypothetical protein